MTQGLSGMHFQFVRLDKQVRIALPVMGFRAFPLQGDFRHMNTADYDSHRVEWCQPIGIGLVKVSHIGIERIACAAKAGSQLCPL